MTFAKMAEDTRTAFYNGKFGIAEARNALKLINHLTAALEAHEAAQPFLREQLVSINARAEALQARVAELEAERQERESTVLDYAKDLHDAEYWLATAKERVKELEATLTAGTPDALERLRGALADKQLCVVKFTDMLDKSAAESELARMRERVEELESQLKAANLDGEVKEKK